MRRLLSLAWIAVAALADPHWIQFRSGPFEVFTDAGPHAGREALLRLEQFRHALGQTLGDPDLATPVPIRVLVFKKLEIRSSQPILRGRDRFDILLAAGAPLSRGLLGAATRLLLDSHIARMPAPIERGLTDLFSTLAIAGTHLTLGRPPSKPGLDWARMHLLAVSPEYYGKLRVLLFNLRQGVDADAAYRNAFGKSAAEIEKEAARHLAAGNFQTVAIPGRALSEHDFAEQAVEPADARLARADLMLGPESRSAYEALLQDHVHVPEAWEGLGRMALRDGRPEEARKDFAAAIQAGSQSADCYLDLARLERDDAKVKSALEQAARLNPKLAEPYSLMAQHDADPRQRIAHLQAAAARAPREVRYWRALAEAALAANDYTTAAKAWRSAEQAAADPAEREQARQARARIEQQRLDYEAAERRRIAEEHEREIERLKQQARTELHALENRVNQHGDQAAPPEKAVPWWEGLKPQGRARGILKQADCLGRQIRLVIESDDHKLTRLLVPDPARITVLGGGEQTLSCGPQKSRRVSIEYFPKPNPKLATAGEVATIEFQ